MKLIPRLVFALPFVLAAFPVYSQVAPAATERTFPIAVGVGLSGYDPTFGSGLLIGGTLWIDYTPNRLPKMLNGLGVEVEARDLSLNQSSSQPPNLRIDEANGGVIYSWRHLEKLRPYGKFLMGYGNIDAMQGAARKNDTRTITTLGGGVDYRLYRNIFARGDFEYQVWPDYWKQVTPATSLTPHGFTVGASYDFGYSRSR
jgi:opacity protein-like surface antigen